MAGAAYSHESALLTKVFSATAGVVDVRSFVTTNFTSAVFFFKILSPYPAVFEVSVFSSFTKWLKLSSSFFKS